MPKDKSYKNIIPRIYKRKYEDIGMFFWVESIRSKLPAVTIEQAISWFYDYIEENDWNFESAITTYMRMKKEFYENAKTDN